MKASERASESWIVTLLHGLALAIAAGAVLLQLSLPSGTVGAIVGVIGAVVAAGFIARSRARLVTVWLAAAGAAFLGLTLSGWLVDGSLAPRLLGPGGAMAAGDLVRFGLLGTALALALRTTTSRYGWFAVVELALVALALAGVVAAHRDGAINHPRALSDWAWTTGRDPVDILLWIGAGTSLALAVALLRERRGRGARVILHLGAAGLLALLMLSLIGFVQKLAPPRGDGLSKSGKSNTKDDPRRGGGASGGGAGKSDNDHLEFKSQEQQQGRESPVAVVLLHDDYSPPLGYYYFRQTAFSQYNGHRLVARTRGDMDNDILVDFPSMKTLIPDAPSVGKERVMITSTVALLADHVHPFGLETPVEFEPRENPDPARFIRSYDVSSAALAMRYEDLLGKHAFGDAWTPELRRAYLEMPDDPRYKELADKIIDSTLRAEFRHDPFAQAIAISAWLSKESKYSMRSQHADMTDPTADFLFGDRIGYCVHFAHAAAFLLRARGLPARISAGYVADEGRKGSGSTIMLRQKDAHAWAEIFLDGFGWIIVDVAPAVNLDPPDTAPDRDLQRMLGEMARGNRPKPPPSPDAWKLPSAKQIAEVLGALLAIAILASYAIKIWRRVAPSLSTGRDVYRTTYRAALDRLGEAGLARADGETRERFAERVATRVPSIIDLTRAHVGAAYGGRQLPSQTVMRDTATRAGREAWRSGRTWRVVLGLLNPISWLRTR